MPRNTTLTFNFQTGQPSFALQNPNDFLDPCQVLRLLRASDGGQPRQSYKIGRQELRAPPGHDVRVDARTRSFAPAWASTTTATST